MSTQMIIRIDPEIKSKLNKLARIEGKTTSQKIRELIEEHIKNHDITGYIDDLWDRIGGKLKKKGIKLEDIDDIIREARKKKG